MKILLQGSTGQDVKNAQKALNYHLPQSFPTLTVDGVFGAKTKARVMEFQKLNNLKVDGVIGPATGKALYVFIECSQRLVVMPRASGPGSSRGVRNRSSFGGPSQSPSVPNLFPQLTLPPLPRSPFAFPPNFTIPPLLQPPRLTLDPLLLLRLPNLKFEIEAGTEKTFRKTLGGGETESELAAGLEFKAVVWNKPLTENLEFAAGFGMAEEIQLAPKLGAETSVFAFFKMEVKDFLTIGPVDLFKIETAAQVSGPAGPPDLSLTLKAGPSWTIIKDKSGEASIDFGGVFQLNTDTRSIGLSSGVFASGVMVF